MGKFVGRGESGSVTIMANMKSRLSRNKGRRTNWGLIHWWNRGIKDTLAQICKKEYELYTEPSEH